MNHPLEAQAALERLLSACEEQPAISVNIGLLPATDEQPEHWYVATAVRKIPVGGSHEDFNIALNMCIERRNALMEVVGAQMADEARLKQMRVKGEKKGDA